MQNNGQNPTEATQHNGQASQKEEEGKNLALWLPVGVCFGVAFGIIFNNLAIGVSLGLCIGVAIGAGLDAKQKKDRPE